MSEEGRAADTGEFADQQTAAAGGVEAVEDYEDAVGAARGEDPRAAQGDDEDFDDETRVDDEDEDEDGVDLDDEGDEDDFDDDDEEDDEDLEDEDDVGIDDDGNPLSR